MTLLLDMEGVCQRAEAIEAEGAREMRRLAEAQAVAGYEPGLEPAGEDETLVADGGEESDAGDDDAQPIDVGDHVQDEEDPDATMVVVNLDTLQADAYELEDGLTVADVNPEYPADDVVEVVFPTRTDLALEDKKRYAYPRGRLEVVARVHDRDADSEDGAEEVSA